MKVSHFKENVYEVIKHPVHSLGEKKKAWQLQNYFPQTVHPVFFYLCALTSASSSGRNANPKQFNFKESNFTTLPETRVQPLKFNLTTAYKEFSKSFFLSLLQIRESVFIWSLTPSSFISNPIYYFS